MSTGQGLKKTHAKSNHCQMYYQQVVYFRVLLSISHTQHHHALPQMEKHVTHGIIGRSGKQFDLAVATGTSKGEFGCRMAGEEA